MALFKKIIESGVTEDLSIQEKRPIILSNYLSLTLAGANVLIFILVPNNLNLSGFAETLLAIIIFSTPILLNALSLPKLSRIYLCWLPPVLVTWYMIEGMSEIERVPATSYDGLRFYILAASCIPYLLLDRKNLLLFLTGVLPSLFIMLFCDELLNFAGVGPALKGIALEGYSYTPIRAFISYVVISGSCLSLRLIIDKSDRLNQKLVDQLAEKNKIIQEQSAKKLVLSENRYRSLFENASDALLVADLSGKLTDCNLKASSLLGYSRTELLRLSIYDLVDREQLLTNPIPLEKIVKGEPIHSERRFVTKKHNLIEVESSIQKVNSTEILSILRNVSDRKKIEQDLREAEIQFRTIVEKSLVGVYIMVNGKYAYVNPRFAEIFGYEQSDLIDSVDADSLVFYEDRSVMQENIRLRLSGKKESTRYKIRGVKKGGGIIWIEALGSSIHYKGVPAIIGTLMDITERAKFEEQQTLLASVINSSEDAIITQGLDGTITSWNAGAEKLFGYSAEEMVGSNIVRVIPPHKLKEEDSIMELVRQREAIDHYDTERLRRDGSTIYTSLTVSPILDERGQIVGVSKIARDITLRKLAEEEKVRANYVLNERVKELTTLYRVGQLLQATQKPLYEILNGIVAALPAGWQYPEVTVARIVLEGMEFTTGSFTPAMATQQASFVTQQGLSGVLEIAYSEERPLESEGPFLVEERNLINMIADMVQIFLSRRYESDALKRSEANQSSIINNTNFLIWSVNTEFEFISFNKPFEQFVYDRYGVTAQRGTRITDNAPHLTALRDRWTQRYTRALSGEAYKIISDFDDCVIEYSLNPIIEDGNIIGVAVFGEDITERLKDEQEILQAQKQIGELRLMALRSVMNPHFIFNSLNSIQYYIMENDQLNAVTYLSTFSKLIRAILTNSILPQVRLSEELEMLQNYIKLEKMRFDNKFDFQLNLDAEIDAENTEIPSMLIQPYVENAILHGLYNKPDQGLLKINVHEQETHLLIEIEDNGIGRQAAADFKMTTVRSHKSMGTALTEERLRLINKGTDTSVEIIDLYQDQKASGTKVVIRVKI